jgi:hypothetical protein
MQYITHNFFGIPSPTQQTKQCNDILIVLQCSTKQNLQPLKPLHFISLTDYVTSHVTQHHENQCFHLALRWVCHFF